MRRKRSRLMTATAIGAPSASAQRLSQGRAECGAVHEAGERVLVRQTADGLIARLHRRLHELQSFARARRARRAAARSGSRRRRRREFDRPTCVRSCSGRVILRASQNAASADAIKLMRGDQEQYPGQTLERRARIRQRPRQDGDRPSALPQRWTFRCAGSRYRTDLRHPAAWCSPDRSSGRPSSTDSVTARPVMSASSRAAFFVEFETHRDPRHRQRTPHRHRHHLIDAAVVDHQAGGAVAGQVVALVGRDGETACPP